MKLLWTCAFVMRRVITSPVNGSRLTLEPAALATKIGLDVGHGYCRTEIHHHRDENEDRREAPGPYRVVEEQRFGLDSPVRALIHVVVYQ